MLREILGGSLFVRDYQECENNVGMICEEFGKYTYIETRIMYEWAAFWKS
jgi:hypothetical protein